MSTVLLFRLYIFKSQYVMMCFPIFPHGEKWEKTHFSHGQKCGWTPPNVAGYRLFYFLANDDKSHTPNYPSYFSHCNPYFSKLFIFCISYSLVLKI